MESVMPVLVVLYFLATIVAAIIKKARTPPRQSRPIPGQLDELFDLPDAWTERSPGDRPGVPVEEPRVEPVAEYRFDEVQAGEISASPSSDDRSLETDRASLDDRTYADDHSYADDRLHEKDRPYLDERPLEDRAFLDDGSIIEEESSRVGVRPKRRPARARTAAAQGARPVDEVRGLLTPGSLAQAVLLKEILGPPRAFKPYRPPMIGPRERSD